MHLRVCVCVFLCIDQLDVMLRVLRRKV